MNVDSVNDPKNDLNQNVYESLKGFYRYTFDPFIEVNPPEKKNLNFMLNQNNSFIF